MKKQKIAVFGNGWSKEYVTTVLNGIMKGAKEYNIDVFAFIDYASSEQTAQIAQGEINIFSLPRIEDFDGVLLLGNTFNQLGESQLLCEEIRAKKVPALSLEYHFDGIDYMGTDNYSGMSELMKHMFQVHKIKSLIWFGGTKDHKESAERLQAVRDTAQRFGVTIPQENIICGYWSYYVVQDELKSWMNRNQKAPDAIICANDIMAIGACAYMQKIGYHVPGQVMVTGFDHLETGQTYYPAITSVDRGWADHGYQGILQLIKKINGEPCEQNIMFHSVLAAEESCGCRMDSMQKERQLNACCMRYSQLMDGTVYDWHLSGIDESTSHIKNKDELNRKLSNFFQNSHAYEGDNFGVYLDTNFIESFERDIPLRTVGYSEEMEVIFSMKNSMVQPIKRIKTRDMLANYDTDSKEAHIYMFFSLYDVYKCIGYASLCDRIDMVKDFSMQLWAKHISEGLKRTQQSIRMENLNHKLELISITDEMTGLYNRLGYEKYVIPYLDNCCNLGNTGAIMVVDIDKMKTINDKYGHLNGDIAIKVVAQTLHENLPESWSAVRYGGDEFVLLGKCLGEKNVEILKKEIMESLACKVADMNLPFPLGISIGSVLVNPGQNTSMEEYFRMADNAMYMMKQQINNIEVE